MKITPHPQLLLRLALAATLISVISGHARAGSATWNLNPSSGDWFAAPNWTPNTVPNSPTDVATFDVSNTTSLNISASATVDSIVFNPGASSFTINAGTGVSGSFLAVAGSGIVNNSGLTQNFVVTTLPAYQILFTGTAMAGTMITFTNPSASNPSHRTTPGEQFMDNSSADHATFVTEGSASENTFRPTVEFFDTSTAGNGTFICNPGVSSGGSTVFHDSSTAGNGTFLCMGGTATLTKGGGVTLIDSSTGGDGTFTANGTDVVGATGGVIDTELSGSAGNGTFIANGGQVAGGLILIAGLGSSGGTSRMEVFGNGQLDISPPESTTVTTIGSLEGDGLVFLGGRTLTIGSNSLSTTFAGTIADGGIDGGTFGSLNLASTASLELSSGSSTYTGSTTVSSGTLIVSNATGSATGSGTVRVNAGTLGGNGIVSGKVFVGTGNGSGASIAPAHGTNKQANLTIKKSITLDKDSSYACTFKIKGNRVRTDEITAGGVTIKGGASVLFSGQVQGQLQSGLVVTVLSNTSPNPIKGTFANLADGAVVTVSGHDFQANYEGGDGNDLTLTAL